MNKTFNVAECAYSIGRLTIVINGTRYTYTVSPYVADKFNRMVKRNRGRAVALLRGREIA